MVYQVMISKPNGKTKVISAKKLKSSYWDRFWEEEGKRQGRYLRFGNTTEWKKYIKMEMLCDEFITQEY